MIDKKMIIESGMLVEYMLGELNREDHLQVEQLLNSDRELKAQYDQMEKDFEKMSLENTADVPKMVKENLLNEIQKTTLDSNKKISQHHFRTYFAIAASIAALLMFGCMYLFSELNDIQAQYESVENSNSELKSDIDNLKTSVKTKDELFALIINPDTEQYTMKGNALAPNAKVVSYVNHSKQSVIINTERLPELDAAHDYQMWADVEGEMINMGVIDSDKNLMAMNYINDAESLNITIEPAGGNDHPTVSRLVTNVYLD